DTVRTKRHGGVSDDVCYSIIETVYQYQVLAGYTYTGGRGGQDFYIVKVHSNGDTLWTRAFGGQYSDVCQRVLETADRGYLLIGSTSSFGVTPGGNADAWIVRISENGDSLWSKTFGGTPGDYLRDAVLLDDGSLVVCGLRYSETTVTQEGFLIKVSADGDSLWGKTYDGAQHDVLHAVDVTGDGGFILGGITTSFSTIGRYWLLKTNDVGDSLWSVFYGDTLVAGSHTMNDVRVTPDYGFVIAGESLVFIANSINVFKYSYLHPGITSITDVGNDQGRQVRARWHGVSYDALCGGDPTITGYSLYRRIDAYLVDNPIRTQRENLDWPPGEWEYVATVPARGEETYAAIVPTLADSSSEGIYWSTFFVSAETANPLVYYDSAIDSGYSVDNLVPDEAVITAALEFAGGDVIVRWEEVSTGGGGQPEQGEIWYRVYGDTNPNFVPGAGTLLTTTQALSYSHPMTEDIFFFKVLVSDDH
ncbi:hypothetical protein KKH18_08925, partial [bacterium]|nr:hypothetical protein [bacterium]